MSKLKNGLLVLSCLGLLSCAAVGGPAATSGTSDDPSSAKAALRERVTGYMEAMAAKNWDEAYTFMSPDYRKAFTREKFANLPRKVGTEAYEIQSIDLGAEGNSANVALLLDISFQDHVFPNAPKTQAWELVDGTWFHDPSKSGGAPAASRIPADTTR